jgi:integrating conjugative element protein (TIGR03749 family)
VRIISLIFVGIFLLFSLPSFADNTDITGVTAQQHIQHVVWNRIPIQFVIPAGEERMITFPGQVEFHNIDSALTSDKITILNNNGTLYIRAKKVFTPVRVPIVLKTTGEVILVDISAATNSDDTPMEVVLPRSPAGESNAVKQKSNTEINYISLMRYAIQHLYSPERLVTDSVQINRTPMFTTKSVNLVYGDNVLAMPLISWRGGDVYVTAILLKNIWGKKVFLDPRNLMGNWLAASFYPTNFLTAKNTLHDRTTLFLISDRPFNEALNQGRDYR